MKLVIGGYRGPHLIERSLLSIEKHIRKGIDEVVVVEDSGNARWHQEIRTMTLKQWDRAVSGGRREGVTIRPVKVLDAGKRGYNNAMRTVCRVAGREPFLFWEEDFVAIADVNLIQIQQVLKLKPELAQVALLRGPHFENEHRDGGLLPALVNRLGAARVDLRTEYVDIPFRPGTLVPDLHARGVEIYTQLGTFTGNPAVWQSGVAARGWPVGRWSEDRKRDDLIAEGFRFAFLPGQRVEHDGVRSGFAY